MELQTRDCLMLNRTQAFHFKVKGLSILVE